MRKVDLELSSDGDMYLFCGIGMRDGASYICKRYSKANQKYLKYYDPNKESKHITYLDMNNLYGYAMSKFLPAGGFKWIYPKEFDSNNYSRNSSKVCDLEYSKESNELHNDYSLAPNKIEIKREMLSNTQLKLLIFIIFLLVLLSNWCLTFSRSLIMKTYNFI